MVSDVDKFMREAIRLAEKSASLGEVPVGCVVELNGRIIGKGHNLTMKMDDPSAHAEIIAIREACRKIGDFRLEGACLFVTVEPCLMCLGAIMLSRISKVFYCIDEPKFGAFSRFGLQYHDRIRKISFAKGFFVEEVEKMMRKFFEKLRNEKS